MTKRRRNVIIMAALVLILLIAAIAFIRYNASYGTKQYSREDAKVVVTVNSQNEEITMLLLPDNNTIIISGETGADMIYQSTSAPILFKNNRLGVELSDGWVVKSYSGKWFFEPRSEENRENQERYNLNDTGMIGNGTIMLLPGNTMIRSFPEQYKTAIILSSIIAVIRDDVDESLAVQFSDGWLYKPKNGNWSKLDNPQWHDNIKNFLSPSFSKFIK